MKLVRLRTALLCGTAVLLAGCASTVSLVHVDFREQFRALGRSVLASDIPSERTMLYLRQHGDLDQYHRDSAALIRILDARAAAAPDRDTLFALMELCYAEAEDRGSDTDAGARLHLSCAVYAYQYLFDTNYGAAASPYHPHSRLACDLYNRSLAACLSGAYKKGIRYQRGRRLPLFAGTLELGSRTSNIAWSLDQFDRFEPAYDFEVRGLAEHYRTYGIGVPLIAVRKVPHSAERSPTEGFLPGIEQTCAATAFLRIHAPRRSATGSVYVADIELYDPTTTDRIQIGPHEVPLETDFTTPLAYMIANAPEPAGIRAMFNADIWEQKQGLHMLQPYRPDRIPVVFVHGLMSSPMTWIPMINALMGDPELNKRCQFWFFMYPTANPVLYSASLLRRSLNEAQAVYDPGRRDPAFERMVIVGHSMGGLLAKFMVQDSGTSLWFTFNSEPMTSLRLSPDDARFVSNLFFYTPLPYVERTVFISTPHRGSDYAERWYARLGSWMARTGRSVRSMGDKLIPAIKSRDQKAGSSLTPLDLGRIPTGIDSLLPSNPALQLSVLTPLAPRVTCHSIIGNEKEAVAGGSDGIVAYSSAHLDYAASELVVKSGHNAHDNPVAISEVRRILALHLASTNAPPPAAITATPQEAHGHL